MHWASITIILLFSVTFYFIWTLSYILLWSFTVHVSYFVNISTPWTRWHIKKTWHMLSYYLLSKTDNSGFVRTIPVYVTCNKYMYLTKVISIVHFSHLNIPHQALHTYLSTCILQAKCGCTSTPLKWVVYPVMSMLFCNLMMYIFVMYMY